MEKLDRAKRVRFTRRVALRGAGVGVGIGLLPAVFNACADNDASSQDGDSTTGGTTAAGASGSGGVSGGSAGGTQGSAGAANAAGAWATGGTAAMLAKAGYPDPFSSVEETCTLTCTLTQGPCWAPTAPLRQDISEGEVGLPLRLMLRLVEADGCTPVSGAEIEIWHCDVRGIYSAADVENLGFCTGNDVHAAQSYYFRGRGISDAQGKVSFDGCFPGWYASRAVHIHLVARRPEHAGENSTTNAVITTQLFFPEDLTQDVFANVAGYAERGQPDTNFANDTVIGSLSDKTPYVVDYARMSDGAMLAWKTIAISDTDSCGSSGGGAPGGGPPPAP